MLLKNFRLENRYIDVRFTAFAETTKLSLFGRGLHPIDSNVFLPIITACFFSGCVLVVFF